MQVAQGPVHLQGLGLVDDLSRGLEVLSGGEPPGSRDCRALGVRSLQLEALRRPRPRLVHSWKLLPVLDLIQRLGLGERGVRHLIAVVVEATKQTNAQLNRSGGKKTVHSRLQAASNEPGRSKQDEVHVATCSGVNQMQSAYHETQKKYVNAWKGLWSQDFLE